MIGLKDNRRSSCTIYISDYAIAVFEHEFFPTIFCKAVGTCTLLLNYWVMARPVANYKPCQRSNK